MQAIKVILGVCISTPIWIYLQYKILVMVDATELMWFLFYFYAPSVVIGAAITLGWKE